MLWLIWIAIMLLTPILAGLKVWREMRRQAVEAQVEKRSI